MSTSLKRLLAILSRSERRYLVILGTCIVGMALVEVAAISSVAPFLALTARPELAESSEAFEAVMSFLGIEDVRMLLLSAGFVVLGLLILSNIFSAITMWVALRFAWKVNAGLSCRLLEGYLSRDYLYFVQKNSAELSRNILSEVAQITNGILVNGYNLCARFTVAVLIVVLLFAANPKVAAIIVLTLGSCYAVIFLALRFKLQKSAAERVETGAVRYRLVGEVFSGIKDVKCFGKESSFLDRFEDASRRYGRSQANAAVIGKIPSYALEMLGFGAVIGMVIAFIWQGKDLGEFLPVAGMYVFAGYRLLPALQQGYSGFVSMRYNLSALDLVYGDLEGFREESAERGTGEAKARERFRADGGILPLRRGLVIDGAAFRYPGAASDALEGIDLLIKPKTTIGIAGPTGSGKTTLVDLMLGLIHPTRGKVEVDGVAITEETARSWQSNVGYVSQSIVLYDDTITRNIAFGVPREEIDLEAVREAAKTAHIDEFIEALPAGYETGVGERGVRLSGGQRQRIGIARALYHGPEFVILDEATSALDNVTEAVVMEMIGTLGGKKTVVIIAHRITTIQRCDEIFVMDRGKVAGRGSYAELLAGNALFRELATCELRD